jgi:Mg2+ and Co2+ transporter CorA
VLLSQIGDLIDQTEDKLYQSPDKSIMFDAQQLKRTLIIVRRACWPERDKINDMIRSESPEITKETKAVFARCIRPLHPGHGYGGKLQGGYQQYYRPVPEHGEQPHERDHESADHYLG